MSARGPPSKPNLGLGRGLWRDLLMGTLAWRLQERAFGGHDKATLKLLETHSMSSTGTVCFRVVSRRQSLGRKLRRPRRTPRHPTAMDMPSTLPEFYPGPFASCPKHQGFFAGGGIIERGE